MTTECARAEETVTSAPVQLTAVQRELPDWIARLQTGLTASIRASGENLGDLEELVLKRTCELSRRVLAEAAQVKADATPAALRAMRWSADAGYPWTHAHFLEPLRPGHGAPDARPLSAL